MADFFYQTVIRLVNYFLPIKSLKMQTTSRGIQKNYVVLFAAGSIHSHTDDSMINRRHRNEAIRLTGQLENAIMMLS